MSFTTLFIRNLRVAAMARMHLTNTGLKYALTMGLFICALVLQASVSAAPKNTKGAAVATNQRAVPNKSQWQAVVSTLEAHDISDLVLVVGNRNRVLFTYEKGALSKRDSIPVASGSKWFTSATILALVEQGILSLDDHPQKYLEFWTDDIRDPRSHITLEQLLSFTSGFHRAEHEAGCIGDEAYTLSNCAKEIYDEGLGAEPATTFFYGPAHMQIAIAMAEVASGTPWGELFHLTLVERLNLTTATEFIGQNPRASGSAVSSAVDYSRFLRKLLNSTFIGDSMGNLMTPRTLDVEIVSRPVVSNDKITDWQYGLGAWRECDERRWNSTCELTHRISSPGRHGWYPWIDLDHGYYAVLAMHEIPTFSYSPSKISIALGNDLHPEIVEALQSTNE